MARPKALGIRADSSVIGSSVIAPSVTVTDPFDSPSGNRDRMYPILDQLLEASHHNGESASERA